MTPLENLTARQVFDSRGNPTIEVTAYAGGKKASAKVPSGASTGSYEALELRDGGDAFHGKGVSKAISHVEGDILEALTGMDVLDQVAMDEAMIALDGTPQKSRLGGNAILGVSMAVARVAAKCKGVAPYNHLHELFSSIHGEPVEMSLPMPMCNVINGGAHADSGLDIQEFMIVPTASSTLEDALRTLSESFQSLKSLLKKKGHHVAVGDEGGFAPSLSSSKEALALIMEACANAGHHVSLALDVAANEIWDNEHYHMDGKNYTSQELISFYKDLLASFPLVSIEDSHQEDDWDGFTSMTSELGTTTQLVGDDLFVTNLDRLQQGTSQGACNSILIKLNQIGTVTETLRTISYAKKNAYSTVISHRSGETEDTFIADLAVATDAGQIKTGSMSRSERVAKYNRLLYIAETAPSQLPLRNPFKTS